MLLFPTLGRVASTFEEAQAMWQESHDVNACNDPDGTWWEIYLLEQERDQAPKHLKDAYTNLINQELRLYWALTAPV